MRKIPILFIIILSALILRLWGIDFGLPFQFHQDEPIVVNHALAYGTGDLNPHFFIIPPFCSYLLFACYGFFFLIGKFFGIFSSAGDFAIKFFTDPTIFYLIARIVLGVIPGTLLIWLSYLVYKRLFGKEGSLYVAACMAFIFLCVINGHYAYSDNLLVLFILLTYLLLYRMIKKPLLSNYVFSGMLIGLAISTKYNAVLLLGSLFSAHYRIIADGSQHKKRIIMDKRLWVGIFASICAFIITNPFSVLDYKFFLESVTGRIRNSYIGWLHHLQYSFAEGIGTWLLIAGLVGIIFIFIKKRKTEAILFLSFPFLFYLHLVIRSQRYSRYALPIIPFLIMSAAFLVFKVLMPMAKKRLSRFIIVCLSVIIVIPTAVKSIKADILFSKTDTRILCSNWIEENISVNTKIAVDHTFFRPPIRQTEEQIYQKYNVLEMQKELKSAKVKKLEFLTKAAEIEDAKTYTVFFLSDKAKQQGQFFSTVPAIPYDLDLLRTNGVKYVVINSNARPAPKQLFIDKLKSASRIIKTFSPYSDGEIRFRFDNIDTTALSIASKELFARERMGPCLTIYKLESE